MTTSTAVELIDGAERATTLLHPLRRRLIEALDEPDSAAGLARRLELPRQKVNYHLRQLEKEGLVELVDTRRKGNCVERILRARARYYLISPEVLGSLAADPDKVKDHFSVSYLVAVAARAIGELAVLQRGAEKAGKRLPTMTVQTDIRFPSAAAQNAFAEELANEVARLAAKYHVDDTAEGRTFRLFVGAHPRPDPDRGSEKSFETEA